MTDIGPFIRTDYKAVDKRDELHTVMGWVRGDADKLPIVLDDGRPFGIVNERAMMGRKLELKSKLQDYTLATRAVEPEIGLDAALERMSELRACALPVERKGKLQGYVRALDLLRENGYGEGRNAADLCVPVTVLKAGDTLGEALHAFNREYVDHLPVVDAQGALLGTIARRSLVALESNNGKGRKDAGGEKFSPLNDPVEGFLDEPPITVAQDAGIDLILDEVDEHGYAVVLAKDGRLMGMVTAETLVRRAK